MGLFPLSYRTARRRKWLPMLLAAALPLSGCAMTLVVGKGSRAALERPPVCETVPQPADTGLRVTETETRIGQFGPDDVTKTKVVEPAPPPSPPPAHESVGGDVKGLGSIFGTVAKWAICAVTLGGICG
jgi:hypothetical protein